MFVPGSMFHSPEPPFIDGTIVVAAMYIGLQAKLYTLGVGQCIPLMQLLLAHWLVVTDAKASAQQKNFLKYDTYELLKICIHSRVCFAAKEKFKEENS